MQVKRYVAADMRRALQLVRDDIGEEAVILSNRKTEDGVEIMATLEYSPMSPPAEPSILDHAPQTDAAPLSSDMELDRQRELRSETADTSMASNTKTESQSIADVLPFSAMSETAKYRLEQEVEAARGRMLAAQRNQMQVDSAESDVGYTSQRLTQSSVQPEKYGSPQAKAPAVESQPVPVKDEMADKRMDKMYSELQDLRKTLEERMSEMPVMAPAQGRTPLQQNLLLRLLSLGFSQSVAEKRVDLLSSGLSAKEAWPQLLAQMSKDIDTTNHDVVSQGGVFAFVGQTGVGKTTTIAKLATRYVMEHGADEVALITTDNYRIAAHEQLRAVGRILDVPVRVVDDNRSLSDVLYSLRKRSLILIDTAGMRQGDPELRAQMQILSEQGNVKTLLVMSASSQLQVLRSASHAYGAASLDGCVISKMDEAVSLGEVLSVVLEQKLDVCYATDGQDIPRDIQSIRGHQLLSRAVKISAQQQELQRHAQ